MRENLIDFHLPPMPQSSSGIEGNPTVFYRLMPGSTAQTNKFHTFYLQQRQDNGDTWADIKVNHPLDYETIKEYNLTIRVEVSESSFNSPHNRTSNCDVMFEFGESRDAWIVCLRISALLHHI